LTHKGLPFVCTGAKLGRVHLSGVQGNPVSFSLPLPLSLCGCSLSLSLSRARACSLSLSLTHTHTLSLSLTHTLSLSLLSLSPLSLSSWSTQAFFLCFVDFLRRRRRRRRSDPPPPPTFIHKRWHVENIESERERARASEFIRNGIRASLLGTVLHNRQSRAWLAGRLRIALRISSAILVWLVLSCTPFSQSP